MMELKNLAVPAVYALITFLGYPSQLLFQHLDPGPLTRNELILANVLLVCIYVTYTKSVFVDPGAIPRSSSDDGHGKEAFERKERGSVGAEEEVVGSGGGGKKGAEGGQLRTKWCRKCDAVKPPRAHHCKECKRCIPKMDHHCPWTANCVSHTTFPHFLRFLLYTTLGLSLLAYLLWIRLSILWSQRDMPAYLGPSAFLVGHLFLTTVTNTLTLFALSVLLIRNLWCLAVNTTTIEGWEIERHRTLVRRARHFGGWLDAPDGTRVRIRRQEFPYDIGFWANVVQGMDSANPITWLNPFAPTPRLSPNLSYPTNDFEDASLSWPPPDPDRSYVRRPTPRSGAKPAGQGGEGEEGFVFTESSLDPKEALAAFRARQQADIVRRRKPFVQRLQAAKASRDDVGSGVDVSGGGYSISDHDEDGEEDDDERGGDGAGNRDRSDGKGKDADGEEAWRNSEGERLQDFGVDEEVEFYDEPTVASAGGVAAATGYYDGGEDDDDDVPLSELLERKRRAMAA